MLPTVEQGEGSLAHLASVAVEILQRSSVTLGPGINSAPQMVNSPNYHDQWGPLLEFHRAHHQVYAQQLSPSPMVIPNPRPFGSHVPVETPQVPQAHAHTDPQVANQQAEDRPARQLPVSVSREAAPHLNHLMAKRARSCSFHCESLFKLSVC